MNEKHEKEAKIKEMEIYLQKEGQVSDIKELRAKYENLKSAQQKEYSSRKEKEMKLEQCNKELEKKNQAMDELYGQFDPLYEQISQQDDEISSLKQDKQSSIMIKQSLEAKIISLNLELTKTTHLLNQISNEKKQLEQKNENFIELQNILKAESE